MPSSEFPIADISKQRFERYLQWADGNYEQAVELYLFNIQLSSEFYFPLQTLEVTLRNRINQVMNEAYGDGWLTDKKFPFVRTHESKLDKEINSLRKIKLEVTDAILIAQINFSFWTSFFANKYDPQWRVTLYKTIVPEQRSTISRKILEEKLEGLKKLRNRIAHHEPIIQFDLECYYKDVFNLIFWISPVCANWCHSNSGLESKIQQWQKSSLKNSSPRVQG
ncbi:MAG: Abi family protein [Candidatus Pacebacteria bacterium]|nr:Abi family protein [Candidatus Paceibacterota bacterium]